MPSLTTLRKQYGSGDFGELSLDYVPADAAQVRPAELSLGNIEPIIGSPKITVKNSAKVLPQSRLGGSGRASQHHFKEADQWGDGYPQPSSMVVRILPIGISLLEARLISSHYRLRLHLDFGLSYCPGHGLTRFGSQTINTA